LVGNAIGGAILRDLVVFEPAAIEVAVEIILGAKSFIDM
jgi:hypothetical protein